MQSSQLHPSRRREWVIGARVATGPHAGSETVLVAATDALWRQTTCRKLAELGYRTFEAETPRSALQLLDDARIELLLCDASASGELSGVDLARFARLHYPLLKILLIADADDGELAHFAHLDCEAGFLGRPYAKDDLAVALRTTLDD